MKQCRKCGGKFHAKDLCLYHYRELRNAIRKAQGPIPDKYYHLASNDYCRICGSPQSSKGLCYNCNRHIAKGRLSDYSIYDSPQYLKEDVTADINLVLSTIPERYATIIKMRFGIGDEPHTLEAVGKKMKCTRERIRQLEAKALRLLQHPRRSALLK